MRSIMPTMMIATKMPMIPGQSAPKNEKQQKEQNAEEQKPKRKAALPVPVRKKMGGMLMLVPAGTIHIIPILWKSGKVADTEVAAAAWPVGIVWSRLAQIVVGNSREVSLRSKTTCSPFSPIQVCHTITMPYKGRLKTPMEYENILIKSNTSGQTLRLGEVAKIELGGLMYTERI